jgi:hypothetical protein
VRVIPDANTSSPSAFAIFSFRKDGITVAEASVPAVPAGKAFRVYAESSPSIQTGIAIVNNSSDVASVEVEIHDLNGSSVVPRATVFLNEIPGLQLRQLPSQGVVRLSSTSSISVTGLRGRYNERNDFLITTTLAVDEATPLSTSQLYFPHIADSGGYTTQFVLMTQASSFAGTLQIISQSGEPLDLTVR